jgi:hypothetical protein
VKQGEIAEFEGNAENMSFRLDMVRADRVAQVVEWLSSKCEALSSNSSASKNKTSWSGGSLL